jgi:hypothetical protein
MNTMSHLCVKHAHKCVRYTNHYELILRDDLMFKLCHLNSMNLPKLLQITLLAKVPSEWIKHNELALDILFGQKSVVFESDPLHQPHTSTKNTRMLSQLKLCLRKHNAYNCVEKLLTLPQFHFAMSRDLSMVQFHQNVIQLRLKSSIVRFFPEIVNYFDLVSVSDLQLNYETSATSVEQTRLLFFSIVNTHTHYH